MSKIKPGAVVRDSWGRLGIITGRTQRPSAGWLTAQNRISSEELAEDEWFSAQPMSGGSVNTAKCATEFVRYATVQDLQECFAHANGFGQDHLDEMIQGIIESSGND